MLFFWRFQWHISSLYGWLRSKMNIWITEEERKALFHIYFGCTTTVSLRAFNSKTVISQLNLYLEFLFSLVHQHLKVHTQVFFPSFLEFWTCSGIPHSFAWLFLSFNLPFFIAFFIWKAELLLCIDFKKLKTFHISTLVTPDSLCVFRNFRVMKFYCEHFINGFPTCPQAGEDKIFILLCLHSPESG